MIIVKCKHGNEMSMSEKGVIAVKFVPNARVNRIGICFCAGEINERYLPSEGGDLNVGFRQKD